MASLTVRIVWSHVISVTSKLVDGTNAFMQHIVPTLVASHVPANATFS